MKIESNHDIINIKDDYTCKEIDKICPTLYSALKGALGSKIEETTADFAARTLCYGSLYKTR